MNDLPASNRFAIIAILGVLFFLGWAAGAQNHPADAPLPSDKVEEVVVDLLIVDVFASDKKGRPVHDLTIEDFELVVDYKPVSVDTFDVACPTQRGDGDRGLRIAIGGADPIAPNPKIVVAMDYLHLSPMQRIDVITHLEEMVKRDTIDGFPLMLVALTGAVRIEQPLTNDREELLTSLQRMLNDPTLSRPDFYHQNSFIFTDQFESLFELLATESGSKAVVLFSSMSDVPLDSQFKRIAALAAASRSAIYPVDVRGLRTTELSGLREEDYRRAAREGLDDRPMSRGMKSQDTEIFADFIRRT